MVKLTPEQQDESGYLYLAMGKQYLAASNELTRTFQTEEDVARGIMTIIEFYEAMAQNFALSMELFLKAFLRSRQVPERELSGSHLVRHNLLALRELAVAKGLTCSDETSAAIAAIAPYYSEHRFRYQRLTSGGLEVRSPLELRAASQELYKLAHQGVRDRGKELNLVMP